MGIDGTHTVECVVCKLPILAGELFGFIDKTPRHRLETDCVRRLREEIAWLKANHESVVARFDKMLSHHICEGAIAHRWFADHFGPIMNGRDFSVKCPMASEAWDKQASGEVASDVKGR